MTQETPDQVPSGGKVIDLFGHRAARLAPKAPMELAYQAGREVCTPNQQRWEDFLVVVTQLLDVAGLPMEVLSFFSDHPPSCASSLEEGEEVEARITLDGEDLKLFRFWFEDDLWRVEGNECFAEGEDLAEAFAIVVSKDRIAQVLDAKAEELVRLESFRKNLVVGVFATGGALLLGLSVWAFL